MMNRFCAIKKMDKKKKKCNTLANITFFYIAKIYDKKNICNAKNSIFKIFF